MTWNVGTDGQVKVILEKDGETTEKSFDPEIKVGAAVTQVAQDNNIKRFDVEDDNGDEISESDSNRKLGDVGTLTMRPAAGGY